ncbi:Mediator complex, subunit Med31, partial [Dillenia turbinata]
GQEIGKGTVENVSFGFRLASQDFIDVCAVGVKLALGLSIEILNCFLGRIYGSCVSVFGLMDSNKEDDTRDIPSSPKNLYKDPDDGRQRFLLELEFVQCLANPTYIHYLAQNRYFEDEAFIGYLKYLQYWQRPEYIKFIMYPHCLFFLELLQNANFRNAMAHPGNKELAHRQQFFFWKNYRNNRLKHILPRPLPEPVATPPAPVPPLPPPPVPPTTVAVTAPAAAHSPMPYGIPPGSALVKNDLRNSGVDRRKR